MLYGLGLWSRHVHFVVTAAHIFCGVFWLGWMVFMFGILHPVATRVIPERTAELQGQIRQRIRRIVSWLIPMILLTGLYNMAYLGLLDVDALLQTSRGHRMLTKLLAATLLFGVYYTAPFLLRSSHSQRENTESHPVDCHGNPDQVVQRVSVVLHVIGFSSGVAAAYLGVGIGG